MCGLLGFNFNDRDAAQQALELISYRGPDARGIWSDEFVTLGHNRLSILDLDPRSNQPMKMKEELVTIFNGEIYNFRYLRSVWQGFDYQTESDTEILLAGFRAEGEKYVEHLQGMFAFAVYDRAGAKIHLYRDYPGIKPLYYYSKNGIFIFASELKALAKILHKIDKKVEFNDNILNIYLTLGYSPSPDTIIKDVQKLEPGHHLVYCLKEKRIVSTEKYISKTKTVDKVDDLSILLEKKVIAHLMSDVPVGLFFSGGTDSSLIASILHKNQFKLKSYSVRLTHKKEDEEYFTKIIKHLNLDHKIIDYGFKEFNDDYEQIMSRVDDPSHDVSIFPLFHVSKKSASEVKVVLSGEGGDEYFFGYARHRYLAKISGTHNFFSPIFDVLHMAMPGFRKGVIPFSKKQLFKLLYFIANDAYGYYLTEMAMSRDILPFGPARKYFSSKKFEGTNIDELSYLPDNLLGKADFASSYNSQELRVPLLDADVIASAKFFEKQNLADGLKSVLKKILKTYLPEEMVERSKSGFSIPIQAFFQQSEALQRDWGLARKYFSDCGLIEFAKSDRRLWSEYPYYCFSIISLFRAMVNTGIIIK